MEKFLKKKAWSDHQSASDTEYWDSFDPEVQLHDSLMIFLTLESFPCINFKTAIIVSPLIALFPHAMRLLILLYVPNLGALNING